MINTFMSEPETEQAADEAENTSQELREPRWSVISFEKIEAGSLNYAAAEAKLAELLAQNIPGLCIITDQAAAKILKTD